MRRQHAFDRRLAGWTLHNTAAALLLGTAAAWSVASISSSLTADRVYIAAATPLEPVVTTIPRAERGRSDLTGLAPLFGLTESTSAGDQMSPPPYAEPSWHNYTPPVLVGVAILPDRRLAILRLASGQTRVFTEGQQWEDFTVTRVLAGSVHLERSDSTRVLSLAAQNR
jgi:hypothetical protein